MIKAAFIGLGSMGSMLVGGFLSSGGLKPDNIVLSTRTKSKLDDACARWPGVSAAGTNAQAAGQAEYIFICVKPADVRAVLEEIKPALRSDSHIVSIAGSVAMSAVEGISGCPVTKAIPTVASEVGGGMTLLCHGKSVKPERAAFVEGLFRGIGGVMKLAEEELDLGADLASCMPGFIASIFQEFGEAALRRTGSLGRERTETLLLQTLLGTARLLTENHLGFDEAISRVATKGGITEEGVKALRSGLPRVFDEVLDRTMEKRIAVKEKVNRDFQAPNESEAAMTKEPIPYIPLVMSHDNLAASPEFSFPQGYSTRLFRPGDEEHWAAITTDAGEFSTSSDALAYFNEHFGPYPDEFQARCLLLLDGSGSPVGTATGWMMDEKPEVGRLHWVAIMQQHQGRGLSKPLVAAVMRLMRELGHEEAMLTTQPKSWKGIKVYLDFGWKPFDDGAENYKKGWALVKGLTGRAELSEF